MALTKIDDRGLKTPIDLQDDEKIRLGTGNDLEVFHNGTNSHLRNQTGDLIIDSNSTGSVKIRPKIGEEGVVANTDGSVDLYHDGSKKFETQSTGVEITGKLTFSTEGLANGSINLGIDEDLNLYHDNSDAYFDNNVGDFYIRNDGNSTTEKVRIQAKGGEQSIIASPNGSVELYYDNTKMFETTADGATLQKGLTVRGIEGGEAQIRIEADEADNASDRFRLVATDGAGFELQQYDGSQYDSLLRGQKNIGVDLFYNNNRRLTTNSVGISVVSEGNTPIVQWEGANSNGVGKIDCDQVSPTTSDMRFYTETSGSLSEKMRLDSSGNLLVACTTTDSNNSDGVRLFSTGTIAATRTNEYAAILRRSASDGGVVLFRRGSNNVGGINVTSSSTSYATSSDYRLKENVVNMTGAIDRVKALAPKRFNFIVDADTTVDGFLAHEVQTVVPEAITGEKDAVDSDNNPVYQGIDQSKLVPLLTAALQEAVAKIEVLETKVAALEAA